MNRNVLTTIGGLLLVAAVVVGTFLYGDQQRQHQLKSDKTAAKQEQTKSTVAASQSKPAAESKPAASSTSSDKAKAKPAASTSTATKDKQKAASTQKPAKAATAATTPATQTPKTGSGLMNVVALSLMAVAALAYRRSRKLTPQHI